MGNIETMEQSNNSFFSAFPFLEVTSGFFIGLAVGYFFKKSFKILLLVIGLVMVAIFVLEAQDIIHLNSNNLLGVADKILALLKQSFYFLKERLSFLELSGGIGAVAGFLVGLKMG